VVGNVDLDPSARDHRPSLGTKQVEGLLVAWSLPCSLNQPREDALLLGLHWRADRFCDRFSPESRYLEQLGIRNAHAAGQRPTEKPTMDEIREDAEQPSVLVAVPLTESRQERLAVNRVLGRGLQSVDRRQDVQFGFAEQHAAKRSFAP